MVRGRSRPRAGALLERAGELREIDRALRDAIGRDGRVLFVEGPPGIGKTELLDEARRRAQRSGMITLAARGGELEGHYPYGVARQLFEPILRGAAMSTRDELLSGAARLAGAVVADEPIDTTDARDDSAFVRVHGLYWLMVNVSLRAPVLIAVDDVHWADAPSLRFLLHLARRLDGVPAVVLAAGRSVEASFEPDLVAQLSSEAFVQVLRPAGLSPRAVARLLGDGLEQSPDESFASACCVATGGTPFLVHELVAALVADRVAPTAEQAGRVQEFGPRAVARATLVRLGQMATGCVPLARAIAVLAGDAQLPRTARLAGLDGPEALEALDALVGAHVVRAGVTLQFVHPILRAAIYDELAPGERSALHRRAAELLAADGAELDAIATQLMASEPTGSPEVIEQLREAAVLALTRGAPENAVAYLSRALQEGADRELRAALSFEMASAARLAGLPSMLGHFREAHRLAGDPVLRNRAALELATALGLLGEWEEPMTLVETALAELGDQAPQLTLRLESFRAAIAAGNPRLVSDFRRRRPMLRALITRHGPPAHSLSLLLAAETAWRGEGLDEVAGLVALGWDEGRLLDTGVDLWAVGQGLGALALCEELDRAGALADELLDRARTRGSLALFVVGSAYRGLIDSRRGRMRSAEAGLRPALASVQRRGLNFALSSYLWFASDVMLERPGADDLAAATRSVELGPLAGTHSGALLLDVRGRLRHAVGDTAGAIRDLRGAGEIFEALRFRNPNATSWRSALALTLGAEGLQEAHRLASDELDDARAAGRQRGIGVALRALGLLERGERGRERLGQAVTALEGSPATLEHARALVDLGAAMRRAEQRTAAREPLRVGLDLAVAAGAIRLSERARAELAASGARPRRARSTGPDALTPSELRVARLAADEHTNNEIAQILFVTPKTVDTHLSHVYAKLGISSRRALPAALEAQPPAFSGTDGGGERGADHAIVPEPSDLSG